MEFLSQKGVPYTQRDVSRDPTAAQEMIRRSGQRGVPVITTDDEVVVGFDRPQLERIAARALQGGATGGASGQHKVRLGAAVADAGKVAAKAGAGSRPVAGAYVGNVRAGSPAERAGIVTGDTITAIDGRIVRGAADVEQVMAALRPGASVMIELVRDGGPRRLMVQV